MRPEFGRFLIITGHYGCGKTNLTLNLALEAAGEGQPVTVVDLDIVNPYFRSSEYGELLGEKVVEKGVYVKMARGEMVRWMAEHSVERPEDLRYFDRLGFSFCPERSDGKRLVFLMDGETRRRVR